MIGILEQSCPVWHSSLTAENREDFERIQKTSLKLILGQKYKNYEHAMNILELESLQDQRQAITLGFAKTCLKNEEIMKMFPLNIKKHHMKKRKLEKFKVTHAVTERYQKSAKIQMQHMLNDDEKKKAS